LPRPPINPRSGAIAAKSSLGGGISRPARSRCQRKNSPNERGIAAAGSMFRQPWWCGLPGS
jgi:hypothetical protein